MIAKIPKKKFDAVAEGRKWKQATGRRLAAIPPEEWHTFLRASVDKMYTEAATRKREEATHAAH